VADNQAFHRRDDSNAAVGALAGVDQVEAAVRWGSRWVARYWFVWGLGTLLFFPLAGLQRRQSALVSLVWTAFLAGTFCYARAQRVVPAGATRRYLFSVLSWSSLWTALLVLGLTVFPDRAAFWIPAGALVSVPPFVAARAGRR
jgi:hypothetical protein